MDNKKTTPESGVERKFEVIKLYADNEIYGLVLSISLSVHDWCEFSTQPFYRQLLEYLRNSGIQDNKDIPEQEQG